MQFQKDVATETCECVADFRLLIPRWAIIPADRVPDQCLDLPPSIFVGQSYKLHGEQWEYGQPNIEYQLVAQITLRRSTRDSSRLPQPEVQSASKLITIMPCSLPSPPTDLSDFPAEFISSESNTYNAIFSGTSYTMRLSTIEPNPVVLKPATDNIAIIPVHVEIDTVPGKSDLPTELPSKLRNLAFKVQPILRSKTFYSTVPFRKMPGQTMLTAKGTLRLKDEILKLTSHTLGASSCRHGLGNVQAVSNDMSRRGSRPGMPKTWFTSVNVPVMVQSDLAPTFCSATAARQYSLIMRITVCGWKINEFVLEIPLQILHAQKPAFENAGLAIPGRIPGYEPVSWWMEPERCVSIPSHWQLFLDSRLTIVASGGYG